MFRKESIHQLYQASGADRATIILEQLHGRIEEIGRLDPHRVAVFFYEKLDTRMRQRFQRSAEPILHPSRAIGDASHFSMVTAKKCDDPISLPERISLQYNRIALMERHSVFSVNSQI